MIQITLNILSYAIGLHWAIVSTFVILGLIGYIAYKKPSTSKRHKNTEIVVVSKASKGVSDQLLDCIKYHRKHLQDLPLNIVIDQGSDIEGKIRELDNGMIKVTVVPQDFNPEAIAKGRAIEYFIRTKVKNYKWYAFIDDDNRLLGNTFLYEIEKKEEQGYSAANAILKPRWGGARLTQVADSIRYFDDLTIFRFTTGLLKKPLNGFHGELLLVKGKILQEITFNRKTITEDFAFARELLRKGHKVWQTSTKVSIQSPCDTRDFLKQRKRWFDGLIKDFRTAPLPMKIFVGTRIIDWKFGIIGSWLLFPLWYFLQIPTWLRIYSAIGAIYYIYAYVYGAFNLKPEKYYTKTERWATRIGYSLLIPAYSIMETLGAWVKGGKGFHVINKRIPK